ncbi:MAG: hypothetical protein ACXIUV_09775 [Alkalilacustris sp.]
MDTAQFYGWRPQEDGAFSLTLRLHDPWPREATLPQPERQDHAYTAWGHDPRPMRLHYAFARVGAWAEGVPPEDAVTAFRLMQAVAREVPAFFPHRAARVSRLALPDFTAGTAPHVAFGADGSEAPPVPDETEPDASSGTSGREARNTPLTREEICGMMAERMPARPAPPAPAASCRDTSTERMSALVSYYHREFQSARAPLWSRIEEQARNAEEAAAGRADVIVLFVPPGFFPDGTVGYAAGMDAYRGASVLGFPGMRVYIAALTSKLSFDRMVQMHLHEMGHEFGLGHVPGDAMLPADCARAVEGDGRVLEDQLEGWREPGIESSRMAPGGLSGWNKSVTEGNGQDEQNTLVSMMWPFAIETRLMSLLPREMEQIRRSVEVGPAEYWRNLREERAQRPPAPADVCDDARLLPSGLPRPDTAWSGAAAAGVLGAVRLAQADDGARSDARSRDEVLVVGGLVSDTGGGLVVRSVQRMLPSDMPTPPDGPYRAQITDMSGRVLAVAPVGLRAPIRPASDDPSGWHRFHLEIAVPDGAAQLTILDGPRIRAVLRAGPEAPTLQSPELSDLGEGHVALAWRLTGDADQQSVAYSPTGKAPWSKLVHDAPDGRAALFLGDLPPGPAPALRVSARSSVRFVDRVVPLPGGLLPLSGVTVLRPAPGALQHGAPAVLHFDAPMPWDFLTEVVGLADARGGELETRAVADPESRTLAVFLAETRAQPGDAIDGADGTVHLVFRAPLRDAFGRPVTEPDKDALRFSPAQGQD